MINRLLMELYDDYEKNNISSLIEFAKKTLPNDGTDRLFIGCLLILFSKSSGSFKPRYNVTRENLYEIVKAAKEKINSSNLLAFYVERLNKDKLVSKYLKDIVNNPNLDKYTDIILDYLDQFKPRFIEEIKKHKKSIDKYLDTNN